MGKTNRKLDFVAFTVKSWFQIPSDKNGKIGPNLNFRKDENTEISRYVI